MPPFTRRQFIGYGAAVTAAAAVVPVGFRLGQRPGLRPLAITPTTIPKYVSTAAPTPPAMPQAGTFSGYDYYTIAAGHFRQQILAQHVSVDSGSRLRRRGEFGHVLRARPDHRGDDRPSGTGQMGEPACYQRKQLRRPAGSGDNHLALG